jgi:ATP-binding cassette subfamily B protein
MNFGHFKKDLSRIFLLIVRSSPQLALLNTFIVLFQALLPVVSLYIIRILIELVVKQQHVKFSEIIPVIIWFSIVQLITALIGQGSTYVITLYQQKLTDHLSSIVLDKAVSVDLEYYENPVYHDTLHLAQQQSLFRATQLLGNLNSLLLNSLSLLFLTGLFITMQWAYALVFIGLSLPLAVIKWYYSYKLYRLETKFVPLEREANYLHQVLTDVSYAKEVRVFGYGHSFIEKFHSIRSILFKGRKDMNSRLNFFSLMAETTEVVVVAFIFITLAKNAWAGVITAGVFVIYLQGFQRLQSGAKNFLQSLVQIYQQRLFLKDLFTFLDITSHRTPSSGVPFPNGDGGLMIKALSFSYPGTTSNVLHNITVKCLPGKMIAIVGENGSGKSTLVKLLAQLYHTPYGNISINEMAVSDISIKSFRENSAFLFQDFEKYFLTVEENITLGSSKKTDQSKIRRAAQLSGADAFISKLSNGYQTRLGRTFAHSEQLSGGQWQKLALAKIFYNEAKLLVLDEPTSALDAISEHELFINLKELAKQKMVVLISHRLYNIKLADYIYVMHEGKIVEEGDFNVLIDNDGRFKKMYDRQKLD